MYVTSTGLHSNRLHTNYDNIPQELKDLDIWMLWSFAGDSSLNQKQPCWKNYKTETYSFESLRSTMQDHQYLGAMLPKGYIFADVDKCINNANTLTKPKLIEKLHNIMRLSYTEQSIRGQGLHIIAKGDIDPFYIGNTNFGEIICSDKYCALTGNDMFVEKTHNLIQPLAPHDLGLLYQLINKNKNKESKQKVPAWTSPGILLSGYDFDALPKNDWLIKHILDFQAGSLGIVAKLGLGKTTFAVDLIISCLTGTPFLGHFPVVRRLSKVLYFSAERQGHNFRNLVKQVMRYKNITEPGNLVQFDYVPILSRPAGIKELEKEVRHHEADGVVIDSLNNAVDITGSDSVRYQFMFGQLNRLQSECGFVSIILNHAKEGTGEGYHLTPLDEMYQILNRGARQHIDLNFAKKGKQSGYSNILMRSHGNHGGCWEGKVTFTFGSGTDYVWIPEVEPINTDSIAESVRSPMAQRLTQEELAKELGCSQGEISKLKAKYKKGN